MISIGFYHKQFFFFLAMAGLLIGIGYISLQQTSQASGRPLTLPAGRESVIMAIGDHGKVVIDDIEVGGVVRFGRGQDEFSYLLLDQLDHAINQLTVTLRWPRPIQPDQATVRAIIVHTEPVPWTWRWVDSQTLVYQLSNIDPAATVSLFVDLPKGAILPSWTQRVFGTIESLPHVIWLSLALILPLMTLLMLGVILIIQARKERFSRTRESSPILPDQLPPALVSALVDGHVSARSLAATLFDLTRRDYLDIGRDKDSYTFTKRRRLLKDQISNELRPFESSLLQKLFPAASAQVSQEDVRVRIGSSLFSKQVAQIYLGVYDEVTGRGYFHTNPSAVQAGYRSAGLALFFLGLIGFGFGITLFANAPTPLLFWVWMIISALSIVRVAPRISNYTTSGLARRRDWLAFRNYLQATDSVDFRLQNQEDCLVVKGSMSVERLLQEISRWLLDRYLNFDGLSQSGLRYCSKKQEVFRL